MRELLVGGPPADIDEPFFALTRAQMRLAQAAMPNSDTSVAALAAELGVKAVTLYRYVDANGNLREHGRRVLAA